MKGNNEEPNRVERLRNRLYSRGKPYVLEDKRSDVHLPDVTVNEHWVDEKDPLSQGPAEEPKKGSFLTKLFVISLAFFVISLIIAAGLYLRGWNRISPKNVDISIAGPVSVAAGEAVSFELIVKNDNAIDIDNTVLTVLFPEGARSPDNLEMPLQIQKQDIGLVKAGESARRTVRAVLFGEKDTSQDIKVVADYNIKATNAAYQKEKTYQIGIKSSPVIVTVHYPKEVNASQEAEIRLEITSNSNTTLENIAVRSEYPFGFVYRSSDPEPFYENSVWHIDTLKPLEKKFVTIKGLLEGQHDEERTFRFFIGEISSDDDRQIGVNLTTSAFSMTIKRPQIALDLRFRGSDSGEAVVQAGGRSQIEIVAKNNLPVNLVNAELKTKITGSIFDEERIIPTSNGFYTSIDNTMTWNQNTSPEFAEITPGDSSAVSFTLSTMDATRELISQIQNPEIAVDVTVTGSRLAEGGVPEQVASTLSRKIKVSSQVGIGARLVHSVGPFENSGPIPPKVDQETTYTAIWSVTNSFNNVSGARAAATLPLNVKWLGLASPAGEKIVFNPVTREIVWEIGELKRGVGYLSSPREVAFQVALTPSITDAGNSPTVVGAAEITARDNFTLTGVGSRSSVLTTMLSTDPNQGIDSGIVVR